MILHCILMICYDSYANKSQYQRICLFSHSSLPISSFRDHGCLMFIPPNASVLPCSSLYAANWIHRTASLTRKELSRNQLVKSLSQAAEKYFRQRMRRHQRNMPTAATAIEISDDSDEVRFLSWSLPSCPCDLLSCFVSPYAFLIICHFNLCTISREMCRVALVGTQGAGHESESAGDSKLWWTARFTP